ncbi:hypothetical protein Tco_0954758 [Tanacetum coccineum]|uniref:Uncharacterized protein n=1 Tax=Tanacetum coccineum TaxID=301880 RepID=A0ABQ5E5C2_9ASTR
MSESKRHSDSGCYGPTTIELQRVTGLLDHGKEHARMRLAAENYSLKPGKGRDLTKAVANSMFPCRVQRIRENIANNRSALRDVFVSFSEPLSAAALEGTGGTSSVAPDTTTALSVTLASASTILPISMDDYEIAHAEHQGNAGVDVDPFPNVDDAEQIIS